MYLLEFLLLKKIYHFSANHRSALVNNSCSNAGYNLCSDLLLCSNVIQLVTEKLRQDNIQFAYH